MKIYRLENEKTRDGMWYDFDGNYKPFIKSLTEGVSKDLPMEWHPRYAKAGYKWFSGCESLEQLKKWFSQLDISELYDAGYRLFEFESRHYTGEENQVLFTLEGTQAKSEISIVSVWGDNLAEANGRGV